MTQSKEWDHWKITRWGYVTPEVHTMETPFCAEGQINIIDSIRKHESYSVYRVCIPCLHTPFMKKAFLALQVRPIAGSWLCKGCLLLWSKHGSDWSSQSLANSPSVWQVGTDGHSAYLWNGVWFFWPIADNFEECYIRGPLENVATILDSLGTQPNQYQRHAWVTAVPKSSNVTLPSATAMVCSTDDTFQERYTHGPLVL